jgi:outer membrane protein OmpA-like peptidoglycan-associated protein
MLMHNPSLCAGGVRLIIHSTCNALRFIIILAVVLLARGGPSAQAAEEQPTADRFTRDEIQAAVMSFGDSWVAQFNEASLELEQAVGTIEASAHMDRLRYRSMAAMFDIAASPNPGVSLLDMMVLATLTRTVWEAYWGPQVYGEAAQPVITVLRKQEEDIWGFAAKLLTPQQLQAIRQVIQEWRARYPARTNVHFIRFSDFGELGRKPSLEAAIQPGGLLGPVKEAAAAADEIRAMGDRALYLLLRIQELISRRLEMSTKTVLRTPEMQQLLSDISGFRASSERYAELLEALPAAVSTQTLALINPTLDKVSNERQAAIEQVLVGISEERQEALEQVIAGVAQERATTVRDVLLGIEQERSALVGDVAGLVRLVSTLVGHLFIFAAALVLLYFLLRLAYHYFSQPLAQAWYAKAGRLALVGVIGLPVIAAALAYAQYTSSKATREFQANGARSTDLTSGTLETASRARLRGTRSESEPTQMVASKSKHDPNTMPMTAAGGEGISAEKAGEVSTEEPVADAPAVKPTPAVQQEAALSAAGDDLASTHREHEPDRPIAVLHDLFARASAAIKPESHPALDDIATTLKQDASLHVAMEGHTDNTGDAHFNQQLSEQRARAVVQYLIDKGIAAHRLRAVGYGESRPIARNDTAQGRAQNRRVEIRRAHFHFPGQASKSER